MPHVVWDWNGTLLDDVPLVVEAVNACLQSQGAASIDGDTYRGRFVRPLHRFYEGLLGIPVGDDLMARFDRIFQASYADGVGLVGLAPDAVAAIERVHEAGGTQSIVSMLHHDVLMPTVRSFGLDRWMVALDGSRDASGATKERLMVGHIARLRSMKPEGLDRIVAIGDIVDDANAARGAGIEAILYDGGSQHRRDLEATGVPVVESLLDGVATALDPAV